MLTRRWLLKLGAALGGALVAGSNEACSSGGAVAPEGNNEICGYGYGAYGYGYGYGYGRNGRFGYGYGYGYGCYGYGTKWSSLHFRNRHLTRSGPLDVRDLARS